MAKDTTGRLRVTVKTGGKRKLSSKLWLERQLNDPYVAQAKRDGWRSRAAYKLIEMDDKYRFLKPGLTVVDLGAAPGGWSQVAAKRVGSVEGKGKVVAIDLLEMPELDPYRDDPSSWFQQRDLIKELIARRIATKTTDEWLAILEPADIWCAKVLNWNELMESDGFKSLDMLQTVTREDDVSILTTRSPLRVDGARPVFHRAAPRIGEHSAAIRKEFGL